MNLPYCYFVNQKFCMDCSGVDQVLFGEKLVTVVSEQ
jgi:hypothetical protein